MKITVDPSSNVPLHSQLLNQLRHLILSGAWTPGSRLPSEPELQRQLNISRSTIRHALSNAEVDGLIERVPGKGTYVAQLPTGDGAQRLIGYITIDLLNSDLQHKVLSGAESGAREYGYRILFCNSTHDIDVENELLDQLLKDRVGGILIWPTISDSPWRRLVQLARQGVTPLVLLDRPVADVACEYVTSDNYAGAYTAVHHLIELGHRRIAFLGYGITELLPVAERLRGYRQALQEAGFNPLDPWLIKLDHELGTKYVLQAYSTGLSPEIEQIVHCLNQPHPPTAIFAVNDLMALLTLKAAQQVGLRVPQDLSVVGFDDTDIAAHLEVPLTTVAQNGFEMGCQAARLLIERIEGYYGPPRQEIIPTRLKVRASTASPTSILEKVFEPAA